MARGRPRKGTLQLRNGIYHTQVTVGPVGATRRELYSLGTSDEKLALRRRDRLLQDLAAKKSPTPEELAAAVPAPVSLAKDWGTFSEYAEGWIREREDDGVVSAGDEANNLRRYVYPTIGMKLLKDGAVTPVDIKEVMRLAAAAGLSKETVRKVRAVTSRVYNAAVEDGKVTDNPVTKTLLKRRARGGKNAPAPQVEKPRAILTDAEIAQYLACSKVDPELQLMSLVARVEGGMRTGEVNRWDWSHITTSDFATCVIPRGKGSAPQVLEIPEVLRGRLRAHWEAASRPASGPVFPARRGPNKGGFRATRGISFAARLRRDLEKAGLTRHELFHETATTLPVDFHSFRRAFNTALATAGVNVQTAMRLANHSDERTHMRYVMAAPELRRIPEAAIPHVPELPGAPACKPAPPPERPIQAPTAPPISATSGCKNISEIAKNVARHARFEPATFGSGGRCFAPFGGIEWRTIEHDPEELAGVFTALVRIAGRELQLSATAGADPVEVLLALGEGRGPAAREMGRALAAALLAEWLLWPVAVLALAVLDRGPDADHRLIDLCELLATAAEDQGAEERSA